MAGQTAGRSDISEVRRKLWSYWNSKPDCGGSAKQRKLRAPFVRLVIQYLIRMRFFRSAATVNVRQICGISGKSGYPPWRMPLRRESQPGYVILSTCLVNGQLAIMS